MREKDFANDVLGIGENSYNSCKKGSKTEIRDGIAVEKAKEIQELYTKEPGYYSKEFIEQICKEYDIMIEDFITYVVIEGFYDIKPYLDLLERKQELWIGKAALSQEYINNNIELIREIATTASKKLSKQYSKYINSEIAKDLEHDIIMYIMRDMKLGVIEKNFGDNKEIFGKFVYGKVKKYCKGAIVKEIRDSGFGYTRIGRTGKDDSEFEIQIADNNEDVEETVILNEKNVAIENDTDRCIELLKKYIEEGMDRSMAIKKTASEMKIDPSEMLQHMQQYLVTHGKIKMRREGKVEFLGEEK